MVTFPPSFHRTRLAALFLAIFTALSARAALSIGTAGSSNPTLPRQYSPGTSLTFLLNQPPAEGAYQWFHDEAAIPGATTPTLTLTNLSAADSGNYHLQRTVNAVAELSEDITINVLPYPASPVDPAFTSQLALPASATPVVLFIFADESMLVRGSDGTTTPPIVRLNADGSIDSGFAFPTSAGSPLAVLPDRGIITSRAPYRLNPDGRPHALVLPPGFDSTKALTAAALQPDGKLLLGQLNVAARLNADDSPDPSFTYASQLTPQHAITGFKFDATGRIYLSAIEQDPVPTNFPGSWSVIVRLSAAGARDAGFASQLPPLRRGGIELYFLSDGRMLRYSSYEGIVSWAMLNDDGTPDPAWASGSTSIGDPWLVAVDSAHLRILSAGSQGFRRWLITPTGLTLDPTFYGGANYPSLLQVAPSGKLVVSGTFADWDGHPTRFLARLRADDVIAVFPPGAAAGSSSGAPVKGSTQTLVSQTTGTGPFTYQWLALDHQPLPASTTSPNLVIPNFSAEHLGRYQLRVTNSLGSVLSNVVRVGLGTARTQLPYLANLSGRAYVGTGDDTAIAGLAVKVYSGALGVPTLLRGVGPALREYGVGVFLPNPVINLYSSTNQLLANNDNWGGAASLTDAVRYTGAFPFTVGSNDAALLYTFGTSNTTLQLSDQGNAAGVGIAEIYRIPADNVTAEIMNLSLRARTAPGERVATAGFVIVDPQNFDRTARVLLRVIGPTLTRYGVAAPLADPVLTLFNGRSDKLLTVDNWSDVPSATQTATTAQQVGAFDLPANSKDAAVVLDLPPGVYSVQATGAAGTAETGVTLIEIYLVR